MSSCRMAMVPWNAPPFRGRDFSRNRSTVPPTNLTLTAPRVLPNDSGLHVTSHVLKINRNIGNRRLLLRTAQAPCWAAPVQPSVSGVAPLAPAERLLDAQSEGSDVFHVG